MATALVSALTNVKARHDVAMTGEITLRGRVLPIGGLKEKSLAAHRAGIRTILIPKGNVKDLDEVPDLVKSEVEFVPVSHMDEVLRLALVDDPLDRAAGSLSEEPWWADVWSDSRFGGGEAHQ